MSEEISKLSDEEVKHVLRLPDSYFERGFEARDKGRHRARCRARYGKG
ncbi:hypothetical protein ACI2OX_04155 [Bacillus sp. N9]